MTTLAILLRQPKQIRIGFTEDLRENDMTVEFLESERHTWDIAVTRHPVEKGSDITDHIQPQPRRVVIGGVASDTTLNLFDFATNAFSKTSKTVSMVEFLRDLRDKRKLVTISTKYQTYENMAITQIGFGRDAGTGDKLPYSIVAEEVMLVESVEVAASSPARATDGSPVSKGTGSATKDAGKKTGKVASDTDSLAAGSKASQLLGVGL